ncbi:topoisomerase I binding, arginine/serine-rich a [Brachyhypopomus gauderio]|uniref:topoisomerase I binding, arginine/serine-rich a n=1 Tax=Brachyhypopomus gauderio TaxID=698409 RepID=UPI004041A434
MASTKMKIRVRKKSSSTPVSKVISKEASPDSKCPICLDQFKNISYVDTCLHRFCFRCIHEWSKNKAECPLCKQPFNSIYHSIKAEDDFKQFNLRPTDNGSFGSLAGQRFRYRTTLTGGRRPSARRTSPPPDHGVMFEGLAGAVDRGNDRGFQRMCARLSVWRRAQAQGRPLRTPQEQEMIRFRRTLYRRGLWVRGVRDGGRSRETSAEFFRRNPACLHRLVPWIKRELTVLYGTHGSLVNIVQHIIMSQITRYDMQDPAVLQELRPFLLSRTEHFLHEFMSFARAPFNVEAYDQHAVYDCPAPAAEESGGSDSSVIALSEDEEASVSQTGSSPAATLSHTAWDDETPGPSYSGEATRVFTLPATDSDTDSSAEEAGPSTAPPAQADAHIDEEDCGSSGEEDCVIVGFVKPTVDRTPELVQLSSDSEESVQEERAEKPHLPQHIRFTSEPSSPASNRSEPSCQPSSFSAAKEEPSRRCRTSPQTSSDARSSHSEHHCRPSQRRKPSPKNHRCEVEDKQSRHSQNRRKDGSGSRNRDGEHSSHHQRRCCCSRSPRSRERTGARETSGSSLSSRPPCPLHGFERNGSSRSHIETSTSYMRLGSHSRALSWSRYRTRSQSRSRARSRSHSRSRSWSRARSRSRSRARSQARSRSRSRACSISKSRSRGVHGRDRRRSESRCKNSSPSSHRRSRHKPSGKRKCKSLHTGQTSGGGTSVGTAQEERRSRKDHRKKKRRRRRRSASVEIIYEDGVTEQSSKRHRKKKKRKKSKRRKRSEERRTHGCPAIITVPSDSDADQEAAANIAADTDSAHVLPHCTADAQTLSTTPAGPADAPELTGTTSRTASPQPLGGALQPGEQQVLTGGVNISSEEPHGD